MLQNLFTIHQNKMFCYNLQLVNKLNLPKSLSWPHAWVSPTVPVCSEQVHKCDIKLMQNLHSSFCYEEKHSDPLVHMLCGNQQYIHYVMYGIKPNIVERKMIIINLEAFIVYDRDSQLFRLLVIFCL